MSRKKTNKISDELTDDINNDLSIISPELVEDDIEVFSSPGLLSSVFNELGEHDVTSTEPSMEVAEKEDDVEVEDRNTSCLESILYKIPSVSDPIIGTPKQVQKYLDKVALRIQKKPHCKTSDNLYNKIHLYMHGYLINVAVRQFPYIKGLQTVDIYQESLIALRFKAIPGFNKEKGMSFLNFAKMCIRRHLITILNTSKNRKKDHSMNYSISIDAPISEDDSSGASVGSTIADGAVLFSKASERKEAFDVTKQYLLNELSELEQDVLNEYLQNSSYRIIAQNISKKTNRHCSTRTVDNALLRIRKKASSIRFNDDIDDLPMFM